ncbi:LysM peptidoglycan-binding domain-containing protein [Cellulomonas sp. JZ18]|uniref:LysM peptidoglycan-binding domain-containing protein n=1 Tax=Cellulomonas sp. JZ18 TaxID=2654191 RepID=UPI0012D39E4E|nr:LysM peptidoglycan-binding domain-containing protein [Cellulomonas sp. JZ18]QGQ19615.1 LysM peptidoglycan-binding domain-containing protein [Cellulomonas sp. JZ18]
MFETTEGMGMSAMAIGPATVSGGRGRVPVRVHGAPTVRRAQEPLRLTRRGRVVVWLLAVGLALGVGGTARSAVADGPQSALEVERVVVAPGDTLWGLAAQVAGPEEDVRDVVLRLIELNALPGGKLRAGQTVVVPVS